MVLPGAFVLYAVTFLCTDILTELYGKEYTTKVVWGGFGFSAFAMIVIAGVGALRSPAFASEVNGAYDVFFATNARIVIGSMVAYLISQNVDVRLFSLLKSVTKGRHKWLRNNLSTMTSQAIDTSVFILIAFWGSPGIVAIMLSQYIVKLIVAALDTPVFYFLTRNRH
jgi:uncharacterized integral membrane protein (TIGR00697 family)